MHGRTSVMDSMLPLSYESGMRSCDNILVSVFLSTDMGGWFVKLMDSISSTLRRMHSFQSQIVVILLMLMRRSMHDQNTFHCSR